MEVIRARPPSPGAGRCEERDLDVEVFGPAMLSLEAVEQLSRQVAALRAACVAAVADETPGGAGTDQVLDEVSCALVVSRRSAAAHPGHGRGPAPPAGGVGGPVPRGAGPDPCPDPGRRAVRDPRNRPRRGSARGLRGRVCRAAGRRPGLRPGPHRPPPGAVPAAPAAGPRLRRAASAARQGTRGARRVGRASRGRDRRPGRTTGQRGRRARVLRHPRLRAGRPQRRPHPRRVALPANRWTSGWPPPWST